MSIKWAYTGARSIKWDSFIAWSRNPQCPWCGVMCQDFGEVDGPEWYITVSTVLECPTCGWWAAKQKTQEEILTGDGLIAANGGRRHVAAVLKQFDPSSQNVAVQE